MKFKSNFFKYLVPMKEINFMNNKIETFWNTENYRIVLTRLDKTYGLASYKYICCIDIYDILNIHVASVKCNEIDVIKFLDTFYYSLCNNVDTCSFLKNIDTDGNYNGLKLDLQFIPEERHYAYTISVLQYSATKQTIINLADINFKSSMDLCNFLDLVYMTFLVNNVDFNDYNIQDQLLSDEISDRQYDEY